MCAASASDDGRDAPPAAAAPDGLEPVSPSPRSSGFRAVLDHANLHNLLHAETLGRSTGVFSVRSSRGVGYLHLLDGELIHAEHAELSSEDAALEILAWGEGEFQSCDRPLASVASMRTTLPVLLLRLAKASDEAAQRSREPVTGGLSAGPAAPIDDGEAVTPRVTETRAARSDGDAPAGAPATPVSASLAGEPPPSSDRVVRVALSADGEILEADGFGVEDFAGRVAYAARLAALVGRALGSGCPGHFELRSKSTRTDVQVGGDGGMVAELYPVRSSTRRG